MTKIPLLESIPLGPKDIVITVPKSTDWEEYERELKKAEEGETLNFKLPNLPKGLVPEESRCYICYSGKILGYHIVSGLSEDGFTCTTTGKKWEGKFVQRTGKFHRLENPVPMKGFQGF